MTAPRQGLPAGTVTFLFTDVEGSTRLLHELGDEAYARALGEHRRALREAFARCGGVEVDTQGDAFFYAFPTAPGAVAAAADGLAALAGGPIRVRIGLHTGTPVLTGEGYVGADVHRAARIAAVAHGGQVVVSGATAALTGTGGLLDLGEHRLKDLSAPERLYQLGGEEFPPLRSLYRTNLPVPPTPFLGRERELSEVSALLHDGARLVTLTGAGGTGKTRLALQSAGAAADAFPEGVYWVPLAPLRDPELVLDAAASSLETENVAGYVADKRLLLYFDNFEHLLDAATGVADLLGACPNLKVLVTSREPMHVSAEQEYAVPPFVHQEGVGFFMARARAVDPSFDPHPAVGEICARLDNLPLALELAAARVKALPAEQLLARLEQRLPLLSGGARDVPERQRTLRTAIAWSYDLLNPVEQMRFRALGIFVGGSTLAAAEEVAGADLDTLQSLLDKSLLRRTDDRYWMLETIREFALEQLGEAEELDAVARRHFAYYAALAESAHLSADSIEGQHHELAVPEADNLRAAIDRAADADRHEDAMSLAVSLEQFWATSHPHEGARRIAALLAHEDELSPLLRARAFRVRGGMLFLSGEYEEGSRWHAAALAGFRELGDDARVAHMLIREAVFAWHNGDPGRARELAEESLALRSGNPRDEGEALYVLGNAAFAEGHGDEALELLARSAELCLQVGFRWFAVGALLNYAEYALRLERPEAVAEPLRNAVETARSMRDRQHAVYGIALLAWLATEQSDLERAGRLWGAVEAEAERSPVGQWDAEQDEYATFVVRDDPAFERGRAVGRRLTFDEAVDEALQPD
ncbi:MAG TPA: adenylate/guanylate cyclase domain-containing protein [Gaiellaceae bacterium]